MSIDNLKRSIYALGAKGKFEKSKLKATYDGDYDPPKEKHVQSKRQIAILWTLQGQNSDTSPEVAFSSLSQRLIGSHWATALKTEMILHRGVEQVGPAFAAKLADLNIPMQNFDDPSERGSAHNLLIQRYFQFIRTKAQSFSRRHSVMMTPIEERQRFFSRLDSTALVKETAGLLEQLEKLVQLGPLCHKAIRNYQLKVTQHCAVLILKDAAPLYQMFELGMEKILEQAASFDTPLKTKTLEMLKSEHWCTGMLSKFYDVCRMLPYSEIKPPALVHRPRDVLHTLQSYLSADPSQGEPDETEEQRRIMEEYETTRKQSLGGEVLPVAPQAPPQYFPHSPPMPSKADLIMSAYNQPPMAQANPMMDSYAAMMTNQVWGM